MENTTIKVKQKIEDQRGEVNVVVSLTYSFPHDDPFAGQLKSEAEEFLAELVKKYSQTPDEQED